MDFSAISKDRLHHAYLIEGEREHVLPALLSYLRERGIANDLQISTRTIPVLTIDDARALRSAQTTVADGRRVVVIAFDRTVEAAQHALLKTLEEPTANTHFFFVTRSVDVLLPTIRSRVFVVSMAPETSGKGDAFAQGWLSVGYAERLALLEDIVARARDEDDDAKAQARRELVSFFDGCERALAPAVHTGDIHAAEAMTMVLRAKNDLLDTGPSIKMIVEHLALRMPKIGDRA